MGTTLYKPHRVGVSAMKAWLYSCSVVLLLLLGLEGAVAPIVPPSSLTDAFWNSAEHTQSLTELVNLHSPFHAGAEAALTSGSGRFVPSANYDLDRRSIPHLATPPQPLSSTRSFQDASTMAQEARIPQLHAAASILFYCSGAAHPTLLHTAGLRILMTIGSVRFCRARKQLLRTLLTSSSKFPTSILRWILRWIHSLFKPNRGKLLRRPHLAAPGTTRSRPLWTLVTRGHVKKRQATRARSLMTHLQIPRSCRRLRQVQGCSQRSL